METIRSLLIVDDSEADRAVYKQYLTEDSLQAYTLSEVDCAQAAFDLCQKQPFDVVLLDFMLPDMSGLEVLEQLQAHYPDTAVIMLTGYGDERVAVSALKGGAQDYLIKSQLTQNTLRRSVRTVLSQRKLQLQLKKTQRQQQLIAQLAFQIRHSLELTQTLSSVVGAVRQLLQCDRVLTYQFSPDMSGQIIAESVDRQWPVTFGKTVEDTYFQTQGAADYRQGRKQVVSDIHRTQMDPCHVELLEKFAVKAVLVVPVLIPTGNATDTRLWGLIVAHHCSQPREWQPDEISMLETLSIHCAIAIQHAELLATTQTALEKEKALNKFKSQIVATVSHEYNSPLTAIQGAADLLLTHENNLEAPTRRHLLEMILGKSKHMSALVKDMLFVHRFELDAVKIQVTTVDLKAFLTTLVADLQATTTQHQLKLKTRGDLSGFTGDTGLIQQIFSNLLSNAIKYSPAGGDVQIYLIGDQQQIICSIKDHGIGISNADQTRLFQAFSRGANVGSITGTGLGLQIVKTAVDLHKGAIEVHSAEGKGTHVRVHLPKVASA